MSPLFFWEIRRLSPQIVREKKEPKTVQWMSNNINSYCILIIPQFTCIQRKTCLKRTLGFLRRRVFSETLILLTIFLLLSKSAWVKLVVFVGRRQMRIDRKGRNQIFLSINQISVKGVLLQKRLGVTTSSYLYWKSHFISCKRQPRVGKTKRLFLQRI